MDALELRLAQVGKGTLVLLDENAHGDAGKLWSKTTGVPMVALMRSCDKGGPCGRVTCTSHRTCHSKESHAWFTGHHLEFFFFETRSYYVAQAGLELTILLPQTPKMLPSNIDKHHGAHLTILKFLIILSLNLCLGGEVQWNNGACP
jgi:hypothetical protein